MAAPIPGAAGRRLGDLGEKSLSAAARTCACRCRWASVRRRSTLWSRLLDISGLLGGFGHFVGCDRNDGVRVHFLENDNDVAAVGRIAKDAGTAARLAGPSRNVVLQHMLDFVGGQVVVLDMLHVSARRWVPNDVRPIHRRTPLN